MGGLSDLIAEVDGSIRRSSQPARTRALFRIADLLVDDADRLADEQIAVFDGVLQRFATASAVPARMQLAERLSLLSKGPDGVLAALALDDEIIVARPVLTGYHRLDDQVLLRVAVEKGQAHRLAICERPRVSELVTDVLVTDGSEQVRHALTANQGARLSPAGTAALLDASRTDERLQDVLGERHDLSPDTERELLAIARDTVRRQLMATLPPERAEEVARSLAAETADADDADATYAPLWAEMAQLHREGALDEAALAGHARDGRRDAAICAFAILAGLSPAGVARIFGQRDADLLLVVAKAKGWTWGTVRRLLSLRDPSLRGRHDFRRAEGVFEGVASATARRVLAALAAREAGQARRKVR